jgi:acyl-CoA synthetase (AMP-forming)/AMP-acid ligase II
MIISKLLGRIGSQPLLSLAFRLLPESEYIIYNGQRLTRRQVWRSIQCLGGGLQELGVKPGERVVTLLPSCPEAVYTMFLPQTIGTINTPLNPLLGEHELRHILADCGASVVITTERWYGQDFPALLERLRPDLPELRTVLVKGLREGDGKAVVPLEQVIARGRRANMVPIRGDETTLITYTSGTTGLPKGVMHTPRRNFSLAVQSVNPRLDLGVMRCLLLPFPPYQFGGMLGAVAALLAGGKIVMMDRFDPGQMLELIESERVSQVVGSPTMYRLMLMWKGQEKFNLSSVRRLTFSTEPCSPDLARALHERLGCSLENIYGTTESMLISWTGMQDGWERAANTVGRPVPGTRLRILDDQGQPVPTGGQGEIVVHTSQMMTGYYNAPELTAASLSPEGWFATGDIGWLGDDGYLRLSGRKKDMILRGGQNIFPAEIEAYLGRMPAVRQAAVVGVPNPLAGESIWAFLELHPGARLSERDVLYFCRGQIAPFKIPEKVRFIERLPASAAGKVQKYKLRALAQQELERGAEVISPPEL